MQPELLIKLKNEIPDTDNSAVAVADIQHKIIWYNEEFRKEVSKRIIKGRKISTLFGLKELPSFEETLSEKKNLDIPLPGNNRKLQISYLASSDNAEGYLLKITPGLPSTEVDKNDSETLKINLMFQKELRNIFTLLVKENSLDTLSEEILGRLVSVSRSSFGMIIFVEDKKKFEFLIQDPNKIIRNENEVKKDIRSHFSFISKWLNVNKRALVITDSPNNIGYNLIQTLQVQNVVVSPCFFDDKLLGVVLLAKEDDTYSSLAVNHIEQFALVLAFAISSIKTRELNAALESRLMQSQKLETIGKLSSGMAHDFSNLLSSIFGSLNLLKKKVHQSEDILRLLDNIENCSIRAKDLTKGLLSYGKPTPKRKELIKPNILLSELSKVITQTFPKRIDFESEIESELYDMLGNGTEIYQVLLNLCVNAKEAIEKNGKIILKARNITIDEKNAINYPLLNKGNYVNFTVGDSGSGIDEEHLQKIFDPYFSTKQKETGGGLGLYVTYGIIKAHNGHIDVSSVLNEGTTFEVFIPSYEPAKQQTEAVASGEKIILLADDEVMLRELLGELLESSGYNVIKVGSGVEALKVLTEEIKVDLAIIDYNMPEMNGLDCINKIRELKLQIPIILSSGSLSQENNIDVDNAGINSILSKPYEFDTMLSTIKNLI